MISEALVRKGKSLNAGAWKLKLWERAVWSLLAEADALLNYRGAVLKVGTSNNESKEFLFKFGLIVLLNGTYFLLT